MTVTIMGRSAWGALPPNRDPGLMTKCDAIVLHHPVTVQPETIDHAIDIVRQIDRQHINAREPDGRPTYSDIAYNFLVGPDVYFVGRGISANDGATDNTMATDTISVCVLGDYRTDLVDDRYFRAIRFTVDTIRGAWGQIPCRPHHDYYATTCPGPNIDSIIHALNEAPEMTPDEFFKHPIELSDGEPPVPYPTNIEGWFIYTHRELQIIRQRLEAMKGV